MVNVGELETNNRLIYPFSITDAENDWFTCDLKIKDVHGNDNDNDEFLLTNSSRTCKLKLRVCLSPFSFLPPFSTSPSPFSPFLFTFLSSPSLFSFSLPFSLFSLPISPSPPFLPSSSHFFPSPLFLPSPTPFSDSLSHFLSSPSPCSSFFFPLFSLLLSLFTLSYICPISLPFSPYSPPSLHLSLPQWVFVDKLSWNWKSSAITSIWLL